MVIFVELLSLYCFLKMFYSFEAMYTTDVKNTGCAFDARNNSCSALRVSISIYKYNYKYVDYRY